MTLTTDLLAAYCHTSYWVHTEGQRIRLRIGQCSGELDNDLRLRGADCWAIVTAANPLSRQLTEHENRRRHAEFCQRVIADGYQPLSSSAEADDAGWPTEPGLFIPGIDQQAALALARRWEQHAIVAGQRGGPAELLFINEPEAQQMLITALDAEDPAVVWAAAAALAAMTPPPEAAIRHLAEARREDRPQSLRDILARAEQKLRQRTQPKEGGPKTPTTQQTQHEA